MECCITTLWGPLLCLGDSSDREDHSDDGRSVKETLSTSGKRRAGDHPERTTATKTLLSCHKMAEKTFSRCACLNWYGFPRLDVWSFRDESVLLAGRSPNPIKATTLVCTDHNCQQVIEYPISISSRPICVLFCLHSHAVV
jgi:hypothetical protein